MAFASRLFLFGTSTLRNPALIGSTVGFAGAAFLTHQFRRPVLNNAVAVPVAPANTATATPVGVQETNRPYVAQRQGLQKYLNYEHLTLGSMTGLFTGYVIGKLSKVLVALVLAGYLTSQFLASRGVQVPGTAYLSSTVLQWGKQRATLENILENPSFKLSFVSAFTVAAIYA